MQNYKTKHIVTLLIKLKKNKKMRRNIVDVVTPLNIEAQHRLLYAFLQYEKIN